MDAGTLVPVAETFFPYDAGTGAAITEDQWREMWDPIFGSGVFRGVLGGLAVTANGSGLQVFAATGRAWSKGNYYENDAEITLPISPNAASNPRIDRVILRNDFTANTMHIEVREGVAAVSPAPPALEQSVSAWDVPLAQVRVEAGAVSIIAAKVTDERQYAGPSGILDIDADKLENHPAAYFATAAALSTESTVRAAAAAFFSSALSTEATTRHNADTAEATARANAVTAEATARANAVTAEANTRASADTTEAATRLSEDRKRPRLAAVRGVIAGSGFVNGNEVIEQTGHEVVTVSSGGQIHLVFPEAFPNNLLYFNIISADDVVFVGTLVLQQFLASTSEVYVMAYNLDGSTYSGPIRIVWEAKGQ